MNSPFPSVIPPEAQMMIVGAPQTEIHAPMPWDLVPPEILAMGGGAALVAAGVAGIVRRALPGSRRAPVLPLRWRAKLRLHPGPGWVGDWELWREMGIPAARRVARSARGSLSWWDLHRPGAWRDWSVELGTGHGWLLPRYVLLDTESVVLTIIGPRRGKTAMAACQVADHDGPVVTTSLNGELASATVKHRAQRGTIYNFNPEGLGDLANTVHWSPVRGCEDTTLAAARVRSMVQGQGNGLTDEGFWENQACMVLGGYLHAAALGGYDMRDVYGWVTSGDDTPLRILRQSLGANPIDAANVRHFLQHMPERTAGSVTATLTSVLSWMQHPGVADVVAPRGRDDVQWLDFEKFLTSRGDTLYLTSRGADGTTQPLFAALLDELARTARRVADARPGKRLDPVVSLQLDEIANIAYVPVDQWASWMGGRGLRISVYAQSWAQLVGRYGQQGAEALWACAAAVVVGGTTEATLLERVSAAAGTVEVRGRDRVTGTGENKTRERTYRDIPVLPAAQMRLPRFTAVVLSDRVPPILVHTPRPWKRWDLRWGGVKQVPIGRPEPRQVPEPDLGLRERLHAPVADELQERRERATEAAPLRLRSTATGETASAPAEGQGQQAPALPPQVRHYSAPLPPVPAEPTPAAPSEPSGPAQGAERPHPAPWELPRSSPGGPDSAPSPYRRMPWEEE